MIDLRTPAGILLLIVILAAIPLTYAFTPAAVAVITSMVSSLFGALFMSSGRPPENTLQRPNTSPGGFAVQPLPPMLVVPMPKEESK